jgi:hypothetical protein
MKVSGVVQSRWVDEALGKGRRQLGALNLAAAGPRLRSQQGLEARAAGAVIRVGAAAGALG